MHPQSHPPQVLEIPDSVEAPMALPPKLGAPDSRGRPWYAGRMSASGGYLVDPSDPRAPPLSVWEQMSAAERQRVLDELPSEIEALPEGDLHRLPKQRGLEALDAYFRRTGRRVYLSAELPVYYPGERMFAPDLIAVCDVDPHERNHWVTAHEGRGLDFVLEVTLAGSRKKDLEENVVRFARLGIQEYFVFDRARCRLHGWQLSAAAGQYEPLVPQVGRWRSAVLGLDLGLEADRFRFYAGSAVLPDAVELIERANRVADELQSKFDALEQAFAHEQQRAEHEQQRRELAEGRVRELEAEIERLSRG